MAKILIIDDDGIVRDALSVFLLRDGYEVASASDGKSGIEAFRREKPDLVVLDRALPGLTGSGVFEEISKLSGGKVPVIILTGYDDPAEGAEYLRKGAAAFLSKGDGLSRVLGAIERIIMPAASPDGLKRALEAAAPAAGKPGGPLVLLAEDDDETRRILAQFLKTIGCAVLEAADGDSAEALARVHRPDIVVLDINMPGKTGPEVLRSLAKDLPDTGFLMASGVDDETIARECLERGAFDYFRKPVNLEAFERAIKGRLFLNPGP